MAKQLNVSLAFTADTSKAKQQIQQLQQSLTELTKGMTSSAMGSALTKDIQQATEAAASLKVQLQQATNVNTGQLDLTKFRQSLQQSGMSLESYRKALSTLGPEGNKAFYQVANAITKAEMPLRKSNALIQQFGVTLANTARWQISSSVLHGFMGAVQSAFGYAQDLNESLNNIRIVTGFSTDEMAKFADQANRAAQALSTTTTQYTDAALIYYQQGLNDQEVLARTETTIKLANVSRQSAEEVSDQMTAIWNNFYDGSKSLEYYADVITALGAATASSSEEISTGLEKFAAVAETVGLSYEYATSALATITATTRMSADTVGTGLRTLFSRLQGLKLGETLEDGVDLNKYSQALETVGVHALDASGELRNMDDILNDLGERWETLSKAQQTALAQTVGGVRQYTNLIALMDNWDFMQENLQVAEDAEGTLQEQADIYAESWEAAQKRVKAAAEAVYDSLINDEFFIDVLNFGSEVLGFVNNLIKQLGGVKGVITAIANVLLTTFSGSIASNIDRMTSNLQIGTQKANNEAFKKEAAQQAGAMGADMGDEASAAFYERRAGLNQTLLDNEGKLTEARKQELQILLDANEALGQSVIKQNEEAIALDQQVDKEANLLKMRLQSKNQQGAKVDVDSYVKAQKLLGQMNSSAKMLGSTMSASVKAPAKDLENMSSRARAAFNGLPNELKASAGAASAEVEGLMNDVDSMIASGKDADGMFDGAKVDTDELEAKLKRIQELTLQIAGINRDDTFGEFGDDIPDSTVERLQNLGDKAFESGEKAQQGAAGIDRYNSASDNLEKNIEKPTAKVSTFGQRITACAQVITAATMVFNTFKNAVATIKDPNTSGFEKFMTILGSIAMVIPMVVSSITAMTTAFNAESIAAAKANLIGAKDAVVKGVQTAATIVATIAQHGFNAAVEANPLGAFLLVIMAVVAAIGLLIGLFVSFANAESKEAKAAEQAEQAAKNLAEAYNESKQAYEELKSSITEYDEAKSAIEEMTRGTQEWKDAIIDANDKALQLIDTLGLTTDAYEINSDGLIEFKDGVLEAAQSEQAAQMAQMQSASIMANANAKSARAAADLQQLKDDNHMSYLGGAAVGAGAGAALGSVVPALGTAAGALLGAATGLVTVGVNNTLSDERIENAINRLTEGDLAEQFAKGISDEDLMSELDINDAELLASIKDLATTINNNTEAQHASAQLAAQSALQNNEKIQNSQYKDEISQAAGRIYEQSYYDEDNYQKYLDAASSRGIFNTGTNASKEAMAQYAEAMGLNDLKKYEVTNYKGDGTVEYKYIDDEGQEQKKIVTAEEIAATLAAADAAKELEGAAEKLIQTFQELDASGKAYDQALKDFIASGDLEGSTSGEFSALQEEVDKAGGSEAYLNQRFGGENGILDDEEAKALGYESAQAFREAFQAELDETAESWAELDLSDVNLTGIDNISLKTGQALRDMLDKLKLGPMGEAAGTEFVDGLNKMLEGMDEEDQQAALNSLMDIDWSSWDAMDQARAILAEYNQELDMADPYWQTFIADMRTANLAQPSFESLKNTLSGISSILSDLNFGDAIKDDDYNKLVQYKSEWADFFTTQADGTHQFIGNQEQLMEIMRDNITEEKRELEERARLSETLENAGWHTIDSEGNNTGAIDFTDAEQLKGISLESLMQGDSFKNVVESLGYDIQEVMDWAADPETYRENIDLLFEGVADYMGEDYDALSEQVDEMMASTATSLYDLFEMRGKISEEAISKQVEVLKQELIDSATSLEELDAAFNQISLFEGDDVTLNSQQRAEALLNLATQYENTTREAEAYNQAVQNLELNHAGTGFTEASMKALQEAEDNLRAAIIAGEAASKYSLDAKVIEKQAKAIRELNDDLGMSAEQATKLAVANQRMNKGVKALNEGFADWRKTLKSADKTSADYAEAVVDIEDAIRDLVAATDDWELPDEFLESEENLDLIAKAAEGDELAINQLGNRLAQAGVEALEFNEGLAEAYNQAFGADIDASTFEEAKNIVLDGINDIYNNLEALNNGTMTLDEAMNGMGSSWVEGLNQMAIATGMSVDDMNNMLNQLGVQAKVETLNVPQQMEVPTYEEYSEQIGTKSFTYTAQVPDGEGGYRNETYTQEAPVIRRFSVPGPSVQVEGYQQVAQISTVDGDVPAPQISFTGVGGTANRGGSNRGGGVSPSSTGGGKKGGGGGGGGSKNKETKEKKNASDEIERYHKINQQIERQSEQLDRLGKAKDRAFGPQKQKLFKEELQNLANISDMYREHMRQSGEWLEKDKAVMEKYGANISETDGTILNYAALMQQQIDIYNKAVDAYNNSAQDDADKERLKAAEEAYKQFTDDLKQYEETVKQHQEDIANYVDSMIQRYDTMKEKTAEAIEFRLEFDESVITQLDRMIDRLDTWNAGMYNSVDIMEKLNQKTGALIDKNSTLETGMQETLEHFLMDYKEFDENGKVSYQTGLSKEQSDAFIKRFENNQLTQKDIEMLAHMPEEERQALMDYADQRQENTDALIESAQAVVDNIKNQFDKSVEEMENAAKPIERARAALDNYSSIIEIVGQDYLGITDEYMQEFRQQSWNVLHNQTMALKAQKESLEAQRKDIMEAMENAPPEMAEMYRNMLKDVDDEIASKTDEWYSSWQEELSRARENFAATVDSIKNNLLDAFAGPNNTWVQMQQSLEFAKEKADEMVPEYKQIYELSKLNRDINKSIDDTDNIKNKKALRDLQKEINKLSEEGVQVSQYDLDNARRKYELELARLQLEESQNVKDTVRLNKDSEGNWSYIYTADEEDVAAAEQNYEDKLYAMQEANAQYINELQDNIVSLEEQYAEKIAEIMNDQTLTDEQRNAMIEALDERFQERMAFLTTELEKTVENNKDLYDNDWAWYAEYTERQNAANEGMTEYNREQQGYRLGDEEEFVTSFNDTILGMQTGYDDFGAFQDGMTNAAEEAKNAMIQAYKEELEPNITTSMEDAGTSVDGFAEDMQEQVDTVIVPEAQAAQEAVEQMGNEAVEVMDQLITQAESWATKYGEIMQAIIDKNDLVIESINKVNGALSQLQEDQIGHDDTEGQGVEGGPGNGEGGGSGSGGGQGEGTSTREFNDTVARKIAADIWVWGGQRSGWYNNPTRKQRLTEKFGSSGAALVQGIINRDAEAGRLTYAFDWNDLKNYHYDKFDTGGYTGDWAGEDGRMAMLHQKELVLDETDTRNLLSAVEIVRSISKLIDLSAQASEFAIGNLNAASAASIGTGQLEQSVTITAEFPNATDRNEIAEAFNTLINQASQYANRKI